MKTTTLKTTTRLGVLLPLLLASSCIVTPGSVARTRASHEFNCPKEKVTLRWRPSLSDGTYDVAACGHRARYTCAVGKSVGVCVREPIDEVATR